MGCGQSTDEPQSNKSLQFGELQRRLSSQSIREGSIVQIAPCTALKYRLDVTDATKNDVTVSLGTADTLSQRWELEMKLVESTVQCRIVSLSSSKVLSANIESRSVLLVDLAESDLSGCGWFELHPVEERKGSRLTCRILCSIRSSEAKFCLTLDGAAAVPALQCGLVTLEHVKPEQCFELNVLSFGKWDNVSFESYLQRPLMRSEPRCQSLLLEEQDAKCVVDAVTTAIMEHRKETRNEGLAFTDASFPHTEGSILGQQYCNAQATDATGKLPSHNKLKWRRLVDLTPQGKRPLLFSNGSSCEDICQGWLGNSLFCAVVDALATRHDIIQNAFYPSSYNEAGIYAVRVIVNKKPYCVLVDDFLPSDGGRAAFGRSSDNTEWWFALYEKVFAKIFGYYHFLSAESERWEESWNNLPSVWEIVSGASHVSFSTAQGDCIAQVRSCLNAKGLAVAFSSSGSIQPRAKNAGIVSSQNYTILRVEKFDSTWLIQIRNTWGGFEWSGKWSDSDNATWEANPSIRKLCGMEAVKARDDGIFWMQWEDFAKYFGEVSCVNLPQDTMPFESVMDIPCNGRSCFLSHSAFLPHVKVSRDDGDDNDMQITVVYVNSDANASVKTCVNIFILPWDSSAPCDLSAESRRVVASSGWHLGSAYMRGPSDPAHRNFLIVPAAAVESTGGEKFRVHIRSSKKVTVTLDAALPVVTKTLLRWRDGNVNPVAPTSVGALKCAMQHSLNVRAAVSASVTLHISGASIIGPPVPGEWFEISPEAAPDLRLSAVDDKVVLLEGVGSPSQQWRFESDGRENGSALISRSEGEPHFVCPASSGSSTHKVCVLRRKQSDNVQDYSLHLDTRNDAPAVYWLRRADRLGKVMCEYFGRQSTPLVSCGPTMDCGQLGRFSFIRGNLDGSACLFSAALLNDSGDVIATVQGHFPLVLSVSIPAGHYRLCLSSSIGQDYCVVQHVVTEGTLSFD